MENSLLVPFIDQSETFVLGFECGQLWELLQAGETFDCRTIHTKNISQIRLLLDFFHLKYDIAVIDDTYSQLTLKSSF